MVCLPSFGGYVYIYTCERFVSCPFFPENKKEKDLLAWGKRRDTKHSMEAMLI